MTPPRLARAGLVALVALVLAHPIGPTPAHAAPPPALSPAPLPLGVVISGGGSLGAFEAGALYYLAALARRNPDLFDPRIFTGTSAGSINGLLSVLEGCGELAPIPSDSLYHRTWAGIGIGGLFDPGRASPTGVFTREALRELVDGIRARWRAGLSTRCDVVLGIPVTRVVPRRLQLARREPLEVTRVEERFVVRIQGRGPGRPPRMTNYVAAHPAVASPALVTDASGEVDFDALLQVVYASSGVPVVFPPVALSFCLVGGNGAPAPGGPVLCHADGAEVVELVDGGLLENQPLRLATTIARRGFDPATGGWRDALDHDDPAFWRVTSLLPPHAYILVDPSAMTWLPGDAAPKTQATSLRELLGRLLPGVLASALTADLQSVLVDTPEIRDRIGVVQSDWPPASDGLGSLYGFLERDFRTFDFVLGMVEARRVTEALVLPWAAARGGCALPEPDRDATADVRAAWRPFACARAALQGGDAATLAAACDGLDSDFLALLQTTIDRAAIRCRDLSAEAAATLPDGPPGDARAICRRVHGGAPIVAVPGVPGAGQLTLVPGEAEHDETLRLLTAHGFRFDDLGLGRTSYELARMRVSALVHDIAGTLASQQPGDEILWRIAGRTASQTLAYRPPAHELHLLAGGTWELGWSVTDHHADWRWLRFGLGLTIDGLTASLDGEQRAFVALTPGAGLEVEALGVSGAGVQLRFGLRGGFRLSSGDDFRGDPANARSGIPRSRPVGEAYVALTLVQWVRVQLGVSWYPPFEGLGASLAVRSMLGLELDLPL